MAQLGATFISRGPCPKGGGMGIGGEGGMSRRVGTCSLAAPPPAAVLPRLPSSAPAPGHNPLTFPSKNVELLVRRRVTATSEGQ